MAAIDPRFAPYLDARDGIKAQLEDLAFTLRDFADGIDASPARLQQVEDRLALIERLKRKHGGTLEEAIAHRDRAGGRTPGADRRAVHRWPTSKQRLADAGRKFLDEARAVSTARRTAAVHEFAKNIEAELADLAMAKTRFEVRLTTDESEDKWTERRHRRRASSSCRPTSARSCGLWPRIVSGGELSRVMLALKTLVAKDGMQGKTLIFDEVDAGIGGRVASVVGDKLAALGQRFQVLCITHLPQIAACGRTHFLIEKRVQGSRTVTSVTRLGDEDRVAEIARMMGGSAAGVKATGKRPRAA